MSHFIVSYWTGKLNHLTTIQQDGIQIFVQPNDINPRHGRYLVAMERCNVEDIEIRLSGESNSLEADQIRTWLREHNWSANREYLERVTDPNYAAEQLILFAEVAGQAETAPQIVGGLIAETQLSWLRISIMATDPEWRSQGVGGILLSEAERIAATRGCRYSYVDTMAYQAPHFYEAHGYSRVGTIPDWDSHGHTKIFFVKEISLADTQSHTSQ